MRCGWAEHGGMCFVRILAPHRFELSAFDLSDQVISDEPIQHLSVSIVRFVDPHQPGFVACKFTDAEGVVWTVVDKVPMFTCEYMDEGSPYPRPGVAACVVLSRWRDGSDRHVVRISTELPDGIETPDGVSEFVVLASQLLSDNDRV